MNETRNFLKYLALGVCFTMMILFAVAVSDMSTDTAHAKGHSWPDEAEGSSDASKEVSAEATASAGELAKALADEPWMQEVTADTASQYNQLCVQDGAKYYSLAGDIPAPVYVDEMRALGIRVADRADVFVREDYETVISCGDVAVPVVSAERGTKLVHFYNTDEAVAALQGAKKLGYTIFLIEADGGIILDGVAYPCDSFKVLDDNGRAVKDYRDLERGAKYAVYWFEKSVLDAQSTYIQHARPMVANCSVYSVDLDDNHVYSGKVGLDGYAEYDVSDLESGLYFTHLGGFVEIVNPESP